MNCNRFRFLIQQHFDLELSRQDEQMLMAHLDSCQSCARFEHQLGQVIQAAGELAIPDEALPTNLESLARLIMQQLPQAKGNILSAFGKIFGGGKPKAKKKEKEAAPEGGGGSRFPHVKLGGVAEQSQ